METITPITAPNLTTLPSIYHAYHTRAGGCSLNPNTFEPTDLDCGLYITTDRQAAEMNRAAVCEHAAAERLISLKQVHSNRVITLTEMPKTEWNQNQEADALVTNISGLAIGVMTADCGPVLFCDPEAQIIGAAHAGWQGAVNGVLQNTVAAMETMGAERSRIHAALGPCIQQKSYEVGPEFKAKLLGFSQDNQRFFIPSTTKSKRETHFMFDLAGFVVSTLESLEIASAMSTGQDTCSDAGNFFSHRRGTISKKPETMRHISTICLKD